MRVLALTFVVVLAGCSAGALRAHVFAGTTSRATLELAADLGSAACSEEVSEAMGAQGVSAEAHARHVERCLNAKASHKLAVTAWRGYLVAVLEAADAGRRPNLTDVLGWARELARLYTGVSGALRELGVDAPRLPLVLEQLGGAQ